MPKLTQKKLDLMIEQIYRKNCSGMQIDVMRIGGLFNMAGKMILNGSPEAEVGAAMVAYVEAGVS